MDVMQIAPGLWRWTGHHEEWKDDVGCVYYETPDAVVLIDPLIPPEDETRFLAALDRDIAKVQAPVHILITIFWHARSAADVVRRYGARLWAPSGARAATQRRTETVTDVFRPGDVLPGGVEARACGRATEVVFWIPAHRTLVTGDALLGGEKGGVRLCPKSWLPASTNHDRLRAGLRPLLDLPVERILVSHGEPVLAGGHRALAAIL
jgi:glyoxylase-like metal-dependent hydrolase (beta-lactamase superfamily II)